MSRRICLRPPHPAASQGPVCVAAGPLPEHFPRPRAPREPLRWDSEGALTDLRTADFAGAVSIRAHARATARTRPSGRSPDRRRRCRPPRGRSALGPYRGPSLDLRRSDRLQGRTRWPFRLSLGRGRPDPSSSLVSCSAFARVPTRKLGPKRMGGHIASGRVFSNYHACQMECHGPKYVT
jgi:hypothetical protein